MRRTGPDTKTCQALWDRADGCCEVCGKPIRGYDFSRQHRRARGMGGTRQGDANSLANLLLCCGSSTSPDGCHAEIEAHPAWAAGRGFRVGSWEDPAEVSVVVYGYGRVRLSADGGYVPVGQDGAA